MILSNGLGRAGGEDPPIVEDDSPVADDRAGHGEEMRGAKKRLHVGNLRRMSAAVKCGGASKARAASRRNHGISASSVEPRDARATSNYSAPSSFNSPIN